jgi:DNA-binding NarL/FixJ family response regulator
MSDSKLRVLVADDHELSRWAIARLLSIKFDVVGAVADGRKLVDAATILLPDVIVSDVSMPLLSGPQAMEELKRKGHKIPFVLVSVDPSSAEEYVLRGAVAFVEKVDLGRDLVPAVCSAALGKADVSDSLFHSAFEYSLTRSRAHG